MAGLRQNSKNPARQMRRLYFSGKISDYRFRNVLRCFAEDLSATDAAHVTRLSVNSCNEAYGKLREFFAALKLFQSAYEIDDAPDPEYERQLLEYHRKRMARKRGVPKSSLNQHFNESCWRFECIKLGSYGAANVPDMMYDDLLSLIKLCGPVGRAPRNRLAGYLFMDKRLHRIAAWLERNSLAFSDPDKRKELRHIRSL